MIMYKKKKYTIDSIKNILLSRPHKEIILDLKRSKDVPGNIKLFAIPEGTKLNIK